MATPSVNLQNACAMGYLASTKTTDPLAAMAFCQKEFTDFGVNVAYTVGPKFGGPSLVLGACLPFLAISFIVAIIRLWKRMSLRAAFLMLAVAGNVCFMTAIMIATVKPPASIFTDKLGVLGLLTILTFVTMAAIIRSSILMKESRRKLFVGITCGALAIYGGGLVYLALKEINDSPTVPTRFSVRFVGFFYIPLIVYIIAGLFCFSWNLPKHWGATNVSGNNGGSSRVAAMIRTLRVVNDFMMGFVLVVCLSELAVVFPLRTSDFGNPSACLHMTLILFLENMFETVSNLLKNNHAFITRMQESVVKSGTRNANNTNSPHIANNRHNSEAYNMGSHQHGLSSSTVLSESWVEDPEARGYEAPMEREMAHAGQMAHGGQMAYAGQNKYGTQSYEDWQQRRY
ncbi:uncharacterized protein EV422DRAFT_221809 [Fimicolochytrium jonesii]|uniref:uncharacterized protein n=1 Tax=Fimicolochytrium jonesii TaxID=1396493 RepID=UPI0022FDEF8C|nr:uncharacterized protein EV422DRAFT_221809 [Fimicolochytrium jonesii]KAI8817365.1 hypothetical protein EV422DRAFT_221809 [Fimicolochytrium jonesii]